MGGSMFCSSCLSIRRILCCRLRSSSRHLLSAFRTTRTTIVLSSPTVRCSLLSTCLLSTRHCLGSESSHLSCKMCIQRTSCLQCSRRVLTPFSLMELSAPPLASDPQGKGYMLPSLWGQVSQFVSAVSEVLKVRTCWDSLLCQQELSSSVNTFFSFQDCSYTLWVTAISWV